MHEWMSEWTIHRKIVNYVIIAGDSDKTSIVNTQRLDMRFSFVASIYNETEKKYLLSLFFLAGRSL